MLLLFFPSALGESLDQALDDALQSTDLFPLESAWEHIFPDRDLSSLLKSLARGEAAVDGRQLMDALAGELMGALRGSLWRLQRLMIPAVLLGILKRMRSSFARPALGEALNAACFLMLAGALAADLGDHLRLSENAVTAMANLMQSLFPLLLTLLAAVGSTAGAAFFQPAVAAACGTMTALVRSVTLPLATGAAVTAILRHLSPRMPMGRLSALFRAAASWILGAAFTVFLAVTTLQSLGVAAADGVSLRTAKYAVDHFVPVVGGMFADTMDTLVGASLLIKNAVGITGLVLLIATAAAPMLQTLAAALLYRACAALLEPIADERVGHLMQDFSQVLMLLFIIQLSVGAMFLLLTAQMLAVGNLTVMLR